MDFFDKITSSDELDISCSTILEKLETKSELIVFENNQPQFVILSLHDYESFTKSRHNQPPPDTFAAKMSPPTIGSSRTDISELKIGKAVQDAMRRLMYNDILSEEELQLLTTAEYSREVFNLSFPVLRRYDPRVDFAVQKRDANGYNRYYNFTLAAHGEQYLLCSQWVEPLHREQFEAWLATIEE